ncbi:MAG: M23/M56 family metallopeptidase [Hyphomonadaceae bacterium]
MSALAVWIGVLGLAPLVWSALIALARRHTIGKALLSDAHEKTLLAVMVAPIALGAALLLAPREAVSAVAPPLLEFVDLGRGGNVVGVIEADAQPAIDWFAAVAATLLGFYLIGLVRFVPPLIGAHARLRHWEAASRAHPSISGVYVSELTGTPVAIAHGRILIPRRLVEELSSEQLALIVEHERKHHARGDVLFYAALAWIEALLWFNPTVREQARRCRLAAELDCDAAVTAAAPETRRAYAQTLLLVLKHTAGDALPCAPAVFSHRAIGDHRMRILNIMKREAQAHKAKPWLAYVAALALAVPVGFAQLALAQSTGGATPIANVAPAFSVTPLVGRVSSGFGERPDPFTSQTRWHAGIDIIGNEGDAIVAPAAGRVARVVANNNGYGNMLEIDHGGGYVVRYAQLSAFEVREGEQVNAGQLIARVGRSGRATGPHLHLEVWRDGVAIDPALVLNLSSGG